MSGQQPNARASSSQELCIDPAILAMGVRNPRVTQSSASIQNLPLAAAAAFANAPSGPSQSLVQAPLQEQRLVSLRDIVRMKESLDNVVNMLETAWLDQRRTQKMNARELRRMQELLGVNEEGEEEENDGQDESVRSERGGSISARLRSLERAVRKLVSEQSNAEKANNVERCEAGIQASSPINNPDTPPKVYKDACVQAFEISPLISAMASVSVEAIDFDSGSDNVPDEEDSSATNGPLTLDLQSFGDNPVFPSGPADPQAGIPLQSRFTPPSPVVPESLIPVNWDGADVEDDAIAADNASDDDDSIMGASVYTLRKIVLGAQSPTSPLPTKMEEVIPDQYTYTHPILPTPEATRSPTLGSISMISMPMPTPGPGSSEARELSELSDLTDLSELEDATKKERDNIELKIQDDQKRRRKKAKASKAEKRAAEGGAVTKSAVTKSGVALKKRKSEYEHEPSSSSSAGAQGKRSRKKSKTSGRNGIWPKRIDGNPELLRLFINCDNCKTLYHYSCVGLTQRLKPDQAFRCPPCTANGGKPVEGQSPRSPDVCGRPDCGYAPSGQASKEYFVEKIIGRLTANTNRWPREYLWLIKWDGYETWEATWEGKESIGDTKELQEQFLDAAHEEDLDLLAQLILLPEAVEAGHHCTPEGVIVRPSGPPPSSVTAT